MNQLELLKRQRDVMRDYTQAEKLRATREADAETQRQNESRTAEQNAGVGRGEAEKLLKAAHSAREKGREELQKANLSPLPDGKEPSVTQGNVPAASGEFTVKAARVQLERAVQIVQSKVPDVNKTVTALTQHRLQWAAQRRTLTVASVVCCLVAITIGAIVYKPLVSEWHYHQVITGVQSKNWEMASKETVLLNQVILNYKDIPELIAGTPQLRDAVVSRTSQEWRIGSPSKYWSYWLNIRSDNHEVAFSFDGRNLLWSYTRVGGSGSWNIARGEWNNSDGYYPASSAGFHSPTSPDGHLEASGTDDGKVVVKDIATGQVIQTLWGHSTKVIDATFSPDGWLLASVSFDGTVILWMP